MSREGILDAVVAGGGVVGAAAALALAREGLQIALVDPALPATWRRDVRDLRVFAFAPDNAALLDELGVWAQIAAARVQPYRRMRVWDAAGGAPLAFDADALGQPQLGWIVENGLLVDVLWQALAAAGVRVHCPAKIIALEQADSRVRVTLDDGLALDAKLAIAADGAQSTLRTLAGIETDGRDYGQRGVVAFVTSKLSHQQTCWQRFLPTGPLAFLPFNDEAEPALQGRLGSIVWTVPEAEALRLLGAPAEQFERELTAAFAGELGGFRLQSLRAAFPLRRQLAKRLCEGRVLVIGDAAHVVHPLAGQGVNLGLRDVAALRALAIDARGKRRDIAAPARLARWARTRRSENAVNAYAFEAINHVSSSDAFLPTMLRGQLLGIAGKLPVISRALWRHAAGV